MKVFLTVLFSSLFFAGCSLVKVSPHRFVYEKRWVRSTVENEYLAGRRIHRFTPILTDKLVIAGNSIDGVVAYERNSVRLVWRLPIKDGVEGGAVLADDTLYFGAGDGLLYSVKPDTGVVLWTYPLKAEGIAKPLVRGGVLYVLGGNNVAHAVDTKTGKLLWLYNRREASNISVRGGSQPAIAGDLVLLGFSDGALVALNKSSGAVVWEVNLNRNKRFRDVDATPIVDSGTAYVSSYDGALYAVGVTDGKIKWSVEEGGYEEVLVQGANLYYSTSTGKTMCVDKGSGKVVWVRDNPRGIATAPVFYRGVLLVGEMSGALRFLDAADGEPLGSFDPGRGVTSRALVDVKAGEVYFMSLDANLFALRVDWKRYAKDWSWE